MDYVKAFVVGGIICVLAQILMDKTKLLPGRIMVILVCTGVVLGALGIYKPLLEFAQCGASVPLTGFGYNLWKGITEAVDKDGFIGLFPRRFPDGCGWKFGCTDIRIYGIADIQAEDDKIEIEDRQI